VLGVAQMLGQGAQRGVRVQGGVRRDQGQGEGKPGTRGDDLVDGVGFGGGPVDAEPAGEELACFVGGEQVQGDRVRGVGGYQAGELVAAGGQDQAAGGPGSRGRTWAVSRALSATISIRLSTSRLR
jgi:hypothetical protein